MRHRITLVGYRASGKSTIGRLLASRLGWPFVDADLAIEQLIDEPIAAFFARIGEPGFRDREERCLAELLAGDQPLVLATGGGAVLRVANRDLLLRRGGTIIYLSVPIAALQHRLRQAPGGRPSLTGASVADEVPRLMAERDPLYREVAAHIIAATGTPEEVVETIRAL